VPTPSMLCATISTSRHLLSAGSDGFLRRRGVQLEYRTYWSPQGQLHST
jgi:hypothetical protein